MNKILAITNRHLCQESFLQRVEKIAAANIHALVLREKDLPPASYEALARQVISLCQRHNVLCILHFHQAIARKLQWPHIHLPLPILRQKQVEKDIWQTIGVSIHSVEEAQEAIALGATYLTAGHVFATDCKKDLTPRGLVFLQQVCDHADIPIYALGGITPKTIRHLRDLPIAGVACMSGLMNCDNPDQYATALLSAAFSAHQQGCSHAQER